MRMFEQFRNFFEKFQLRNRLFSVMQLNNDGKVELGGKEVPEEVRKWIVSTFSRQEQDEKERKSEYNQSRD